MTKIRYEIDLSRTMPELPEDDRIRPIRPEDASDLAALMLDAYRDTIDYDGEDLDDAVAEVASFFGNDPLLDMCRVLVDHMEIVTGILVSETEDGAFIGYVMTRASHKGRGLGTLATRHALAALAKAGYQKVVFYITKDNEPSERLFASLGAEAIG